MENLRVFPAQDRAFAEDVSQAFAAVEERSERSGRALPAGELRDEVVRAIRRRYPNATVTLRDTLANVAETESIWYVFRDGRIRPEDWRRERLYEALAQSRSVTAESARILEDCEDTARAAGHRR